MLGNKIARHVAAAVMLIAPSFAALADTQQAEEEFEAADFAEREDFRDDFNEWNPQAGIYQWNGNGVGIYYNGQGSFCSYPTLAAMQIDVPYANWQWLQSRPYLNPYQYGFTSGGNCRNDPSYPSYPPRDLYRIPNGLNGVISYHGGRTYCEFTTIDHVRRYWPGATTSGVQELPMLDPWARNLTSSGICRY